MQGMTRMVAFAALVAGLSQSAVHGNGNEVSLADLRWVPTGGIEAQAAAPDGVLTLEFAKTGPERRMLVVGGNIPTPSPEARSVVIRYRLDMAEGPAPLLAVVLYDDRGCSWYAVSYEPVELGVSTEARVSIRAARPAAFTADPRAELDPAAIKRAWIGPILDGPASGTLQVAGVALTPEPYRPTKPLAVPSGDPAQWSAGCDPAVVWTLVAANEGPDGQSCIRFEFSIPGGRHMYAIPSTALPQGELAAYSSLRLRYQATLPPGIEGLLVMLGEHGGQFYADPPPPASEEWTEITIPFDRFVLGGWSRDDNGRLDMAAADRVFVGMHGTATGETGRGVIRIAALELVP